MFFAALQVYESLKQHSLSDAHHALIMPAHMLGQSETKRQQLRRALHHQRAGIALPEGSRLEQERHQTAMPAPSARSEVTRIASPHCLIHSATPNYLILMLPAMFRELAVKVGNGAGTAAHAYVASYNCGTQATCH